MRPKKLFSAAKSISVIFIMLLLASAILPTQAQARKFKVLHTFKDGNGALPVCQLARDGMGNLYGTTEAGGAGKCSGSFDGKCGTAFMLDKTGKQVWLHSFNGKNGQEPAAGLLREKSGNLYGTTVLGGDTTCYSLGCGTLFKLDSTGKEKLLYKFTGTPDGWFPESLLVPDASGDLYGTTPVGGNSGGLGTVFKWDQTTGKENVVYSFGGGTDGSAPYSGLIRDSQGNLYGATLNGGQMSCEFGCGTVFKVDTNGSETVLYRFQGGTNGEFPSGRLALDSAGNLYGTTEQGGSSDVCDGGCGTIFELSPQNGSWAETVLYSFCSLENCADGRSPHAGMVQDKAGNLYGTTGSGGGSSDAGVVFRLDTTGRETVLHSFTGGSDGAEPKELLRDSAGNLYGVATTGGDTACFAPDGCGVVFQITP